MKKAIIGVIAIVLAMVVAGGWFVSRDEKHLGDKIQESIEEVVLAEVDAGNVSENEWYTVETKLTKFPDGYRLMIALDFESGYDLIYWI